MNESREYFRKLEAQIKNWNAEVKKLAAQAEQASADMKLRLQDQLRGLRLKSDEMEHELDKLKGKSSEALKDIKQGVESAWKELKLSLDRAAMKFKDNKSENTQ